MWLKSITETVGDLVHTMFNITQMLAQCVALILPWSCGAKWF